MIHDMHDLTPGEKRMVKAYRRAPRFVRVIWHKLATNPETSLPFAILMHAIFD